MSLSTPPSSHTTSLSAVSAIETQELLERYDILLIDAYGVLVHQHGSFHEASDFIAALHDQQKPFLILTNDASRTPEDAAASYQQKGITTPIDPTRIITSGSLVIPYFQQHQLQGARCVVLGTEGSHEYVRRAGGEIVQPGQTDEIDVVVLCDDAGYDFLETIEALMSMLFRRFDADRSTHLLLPNPDLIYQKDEQNYGFTSGSVALLLEQALELRYLHDRYRFTRLGKPHTPIFEQAAQLAPGSSMVMLGDQLRTDIAGANRYGIDSVLVETGLVKNLDETIPQEWAPTYRLQSLKLS